MRDATRHPDQTTLSVHREYLNQEDGGGLEAMAGRVGPASANVVQCTAGYFAAHIAGGAVGVPSSYAHQKKASVRR
jgi:hypothetical protein